MTQFFASYAEKLKSVDGSRTEDLWGRKLAMLQLCHNRYPCLFLVKGSNRSVVANCRVRVYIPPTNKLIRQKQRFFKKIGQSWPFLFIFVLFSTQWHYSTKKRRWCAWDSNLRRQDGRHRRIHWAMAAPPKNNGFTYCKMVNWWAVKKDGIEC